MVYFSPKCTKSKKFNFYIVGVIFQIVVIYSIRWKLFLNFFPIHEDYYFTQKSDGDETFTKWWVLNKQRFFYFNYFPEHFLT
jgi:hypothetical protein